MLMPKRVKYRKQQRGTVRGMTKGGSLVHSGDWGLKAMESSWITAQQIEACRLSMVRTLKRTGNIWINIFPDKPVTSKGIGTRQGKGKGDVEGWVAVVKKGRVMFEIGGVDEATAKRALEYAASKLPIRTKIVQRYEIGGEL
ncbi:MULTISPECIES: 50S ribosomal protein L16 [Petrotoga]|uniref:Large ribosomal subunit protein uL16 n=4 Tax=Petrotoga TaxID=28236 RepID=A0A4V3GQL3_9BACT|nr:MULTISPECIES: 50S ribosomal protein L16 [Petrotoga]PNR97611.1 50S ribosomal protein L16 [Petrotoga olearia DSM 13574]POZ88913.1 50S ribosomal protein L16 [Petrotoga sibirica DSM 13575]POZ91150.1 50S ribosomal protein L16 [Petrotoga sp. SL27]RMA75344.1 LSU ribosomal protein L16P [Petrotoga olearia]TDX15573.1 LSU ribosomal protein L16P [Petrotoga sibirica]